MPRPGQTKKGFMFLKQLYNWLSYWTIVCFPLSNWRHKLENGGFPCHITFDVF